MLLIVLILYMTVYLLSVFRVNNVHSHYQYIVLLNPFRTTLENATAKFTFRLQRLS